MQYLLGFIAIFLIIVLVFWAGIGILALIGLAFKYLTIPIAVIAGLLLAYNLISKKDDKTKIKSCGIAILVCIGLYLVSFPILNLTSSVWDWAQEDSKENIVADNNQVDKAVDRSIKTEEDNETWTKDNIVEKLNKLNVLNGKGKFATDYMDGSEVYEHDDGSDGKTNIENSYTLKLSIISDQGIRITDKDICSEIVFNIAHELYKHKENIDFNISLVGIVFYNSDGISKTTGSDWDNFYLGINTINNYFSKSSTDKVGISTSDGSLNEKSYDASSFYQWIEENFTYPEDSSVLAEDTSWTTLSDK